MPRGKSAQPRKKVFEFILYPESMPYDYAVRTLRRLHIKAAVSPIHDRDVYLEEDRDKWIEDNLGPNGERPNLDDWPHIIGELKKAHYHVVIEFSGPKSIPQVLELLRPLKVDYVMASPDVQYAKRYLAHLNAPHKAQYKVDEIICIGGIDMSCLFKVTEEQEINVIAMLFDTIQQHDMVYFCDFCDYVLSLGDYATAHVAFSKSGLFQNYISSFGVKLADDRLGKPSYGYGASAT